MKRNILLFGAMFLASVYSYGQGEMDASQLSKTDLTGSARGLGMAGAFGALGGDITGITANPAGIAVYRSSEVLGTMNFSTTNIKTNFQGYSESDKRNKFNFDNIAYVGYFPLGSESVSCLNFGFNYNRLKNFDRNYKSQGIGFKMKTSLSNFIAENALGFHIDDLMSDPKQDYDPYRNGNLAWINVLGLNGHLIEPVGGVSDEYLSYLHDGERVDPDLVVSERGAIESYDFTLGTNFSDKLYLGMTFSLTDIHYSYSSLYREFFEEVKKDGFDLENNLVEDGSGYQFSLGAIFRPVDELRLGLAYHSPTWYNMTRNYMARTEVHYTYDDGFIDQTVSYAPALRGDYAITDYNLQTPQRFTASIAGIIGKKAILSLDYELTDYTAMDLADTHGNVYVDDNDGIDEHFRKASTLKVGAEYRATPQLSLRAGYAWMQNPYEKTFKDGNKMVHLGNNSTIPHYTIEGDANYITCGLGYRFTKNFYMDAAFIYRTQTDDLYFFPKYIDDEGVLWTNSTPAKFENKMYKGVLTLGYKF